MMTKVISISEAKTLKKELEQKIANLITEFKNETGIMIKQIDIINIDLGGFCGKQEILSNVECKAEL